MKWLPVFEYENLYEINEVGNIRNRKGHILSQVIGTRGYLTVALSKHGKQKRHRIHRLVAQTFIGPSELEVNHKDGHKLDNVYTNLEWLTGPENIAHAFANGLVPLPEGEINGQAKLTEGSVIAIRELYEAGISQYQLAQQFKVKQQSVSKILNNQRWQHMGHCEKPPRVDQTVSYETVEIIRQMRRDGATYKSISTACNVSTAHAFRIANFQRRKMDHPLNEEAYGFNFNVIGRTRRIGEKDD